MSTTTETTPDPAPSKAQTAQPRIKIPVFGQGRAGRDETTASATAPTPTSSPTPPMEMAPREEGTSPGPGRTWAKTSPETPGGIVDASSDYDAPDTPRRGIARRRTSSSTSDEVAPGPTTKELAAAISGMLFVLAGFAAWAISRRGRYELRPPDDDERGAIATPLARIVDRHIGAAFLTPDLADGVAAAVGVAAYAKTDPLTRVDKPDPHPEDDPFEQNLATHGYQEP